MMDWNFTAMSRSPVGPARAKSYQLHMLQYLPYQCFYYLCSPIKAGR